MTHSSYTAVTLLSHLHVAIPTLSRLKQLHRKKIRILQRHVAMKKQCRTFSCKDLLISSELCAFIPKLTSFDVSKYFIILKILGKICL